jgi:hypothetical protein
VASGEKAVAQAQAAETGASSESREAQTREPIGTAAIQWMAELPQHVRPNETASRFPRIANKLAACWKDPVQCRRYLEDLLLDRRGDRHGFPERVAIELAALKNHYESVVFPTSQTVWDEIINRSRG